MGRLLRAVMTAGALLVSGSAMADETSFAASKHATPIRIPPSMLAGQGLGEFGAWPDEMVLEGESASDHSLSEVFSGEIVVGVYESAPIKLAITSPWPFDELVVVLGGELRLVPSGATEPMIFPAGAFALVPRGYTGTWEMRGEYREVFVIEQRAWAASQEPGGMLSE